MTAIEFKQVNKKFQDGDKTLHVLKDVNLKIEEGEFVAVIGPSGSGKSTFLTLAGGLQQPSSGEIYINNNLITEYSDKELNKMRLKDIGFILQASNLVPFLKVKDQFKLFDKIMSKDRVDRRDEILEDLGIADLKNKLPEDLSGGQRQRVAIAKSLYNNPTLILADEPTASLDSDRAFEVTEILAQESKDKNKAIVMVTHDERLLEKCDRVFKMKDGSLSEAE